MIDNNSIIIKGTIGETYFFDDFMQDIKMYNLPLHKYINIGIDSPGGYVDENYLIYNKIAELKKKYKVRTYNVGQIASCASLLFILGDDRTFDFSKGRFLIHSPWIQIEGDSRDLKKAASELQKVEDRFADIYAGLSKYGASEIKELMSEDRNMTPEEMKKFRFATEIKNSEMYACGEAKNIQYAFAALAKPTQQEVKLDINQKNVKVMKIVDFVKTLVKDLVIKNLVVTSADGVDYTVTNEDGSEDLKVGSAVTVDGQPYDGEIVLADDTVITVENGIVTKIEKPEEEVPAEEAKAEEPEVKPEETPEENTDAIDSLRQKVDELFALFNELNEKVNAMEGDTSKEESAKAEIEGLKAQIRNMASSGRVNTVNQANQQPEQKKSFFGFEK